MPGFGVPDWTGFGFVRLAGHGAHVWRVLRLSVARSTDSDARNHGHHPGLATIHENRLLAQLCPQATAH